MNRSVALPPCLSQLTAQLLIVGLALTSLLPGQAGPSFEAKHLQTVPKEYGLKEIFVYFGPNGKRCAYIAKSGVGFVMVVDAVAGKAHHYVDGLVFSADGKRGALGCLKDRELWWQVLELK